MRNELFIHFVILNIVFIDIDDNGNINAQNSIVDTINRQHNNVRTAMKLLTFV